MFFHYVLCIGFSSSYVVTTKCWFANNHINLFLDGAMKARRGLLSPLKVLLEVSSKDKVLNLVFQISIFFGVMVEVSMVPTISYFVFELKRGLQRSGLP